MKKHHRLFALASALLLTLAALPCTALAAEAGDTEPAQGAPPPAILYPAEVRTSEENGMIRLEKVYYLSTRDDPSAIPTGDFDREGRHYTLLDVLKNDLSETDSKDYIEVVTLDSSTKDMAEIIKVLEPEREIATEDGYTGILKPDYTKITVEAAGYKNNSWTVSASRTYPNLSDADASLIPKTITDSGRTLTLAGVDWQEAGEFYNAIASYTGTASGRSVTGYTVSVEYSGEVTKTSRDTVIYTAVFSAENASHGETHLDPEPTATPEGGEPQQTQPPEPAQDSGGSVAGKIVVTALAGIAALAIIGYGGWRGYKFIRDKKRGYV
ncbi:hypothetical protein [uncultured Oscillibacter sp.]|uniref:hypothetical protein n=1 Tax=uncultured Oscillibacter sp. TaxID=876091 RepID=UPI00260B7A9E|nr:hypothetical protein [uncultured Oscillibacter sp.]